MKKYFITKIFKFDAAHNLINYQGSCENIHGHTYNLYVTVTGEKNNNGMVIDFNTLKSVVQDNILDKIDHTHLNTIIEQPTAENILSWIWDILADKLISETYSLYEIKLFEGPYSIAVLQETAN